MKFILLILLLFCCKDSEVIAKSYDFIPSISLPPVTLSKPLPKAVVDIELFFGGDIMTHGPQISAAKMEDGSYSFLECFKYVKDSWRGCDAVIFNLETTLSNKNFSGYPMFASPSELAFNLKSSGITHVALANNHCCDKGGSGVANTIHYCNEAKLEHFGLYADTVSWMENYPKFIEKEGFRIALLNYTYSTNGMPIPKGAVVPLLDTLQMVQDIIKAKKGGATNIVTFLHWGNEYQRHPSSEQKKLKSWLLNHGVDIIIGSHPHVVQPLLITDKGVVVYSLGNYISNQTKRYTNGGLSVKVKIRRNRLSGECDYNVESLPHFVYKRDLSDKPRYYCLYKEQIDSIITEPHLKSEAIQFFNDTEQILNYDIR